MICTPRPGNACSRPRGFITIITLAILLGGGLLLPVGANAEPPLRLGSQIEDRADVLADQEPAVQVALDDLRTSEHVELWLAYVETFSGVDAEEWTLRTFDASDLGLNDVLLAIAVGDRNYYYMVDEDFPLDDAALRDVMVTMVEPALHDNDWGAAAIAAADGMALALSRASVTTVATPTSASGAGVTATTVATVTSGAAAGGVGDTDGGFPWTLVFALVVLAAVAAIVWVRLRTARRSRAVQDAAAGEDMERTMSLKELRQRVGSQLVQTDDAIKTSTEEVGFAVAEFGEAAAAPFQTALEEARGELAEAFRLHQQFDEKADEQAQRLLLTTILQHTGTANAMLDAQVEHFDKLRDLEKQAPELFAALESLVVELEARIPGAKEELAALAAVYSLAALKSVASNPSEAASRLVFVRDQIKAGWKAIAGERMGAAAVTALAAQEAAGQAQAFLDAVSRVGRDLAEAHGRIDAAIAETERDIAEARAAGAAPQGGAAARLAPLVATAQAAAAAATDAAAPKGGRDPLAALRHLEEADAALDKALQEVRDENLQRAKAAVALDRTLIAARAQVSAAGDYITTHRGAVGSQPRALLAEAQGALDQAVALGASDPVAATRWASQAHELAARAIDQAEKETRYATSMTGRPGSDIGTAVIGAILGGILTSALGGGHSSGRSGGGLFGGGPAGGLFGGGGPGGGFVGGSGGRRSGGGGFGRAFGGAARSSRGFAPPSFGGTGTRMRRGGGGRF